MHSSLFPSASFKAGADHFCAHSGQGQRSREGKSRHSAVAVPEEPPAHPPRRLPLVSLPFCFPSPLGAFPTRCFVPLGDESHVE